MNPKYRRLFIIILIIFTIALATQLVLIALRDNIIYFFTPNELKIKYGDNENIKRKIRVGIEILRHLRVGAILTASPVSKHHRSAH